MNVHEALDNGFTLPLAWYGDGEVFARERERIFHRAWQYAGAAEDVAEPGAFLTCTAGDVPIVVVRDREGTLRAHVNVCLHRASEVVREARGKRMTLQCGYHAWTYDLDGSLRAAPRADLDGEDLSLLPAAVDTWGPFVFANPDPGAPPLADTLGELPQLFAEAGLDVDRLRVRRRAEYEIAANWKVVVDNYLECYHCPVAHPSFTDLVDLDAYTISEHPTFSVQRAPVKEDAPITVREGVSEGVYALLWPNFALNVYPGPGNVSMNHFVPVGPERTLARYEYFLVDDVPDSEVDELVEFVDQVQREDTELCESAQRGLRSGMIERGRLVLPHERALAHFQRLVADAIA